MSIDYAGREHAESAATSTQPRYPHAPGFKVTGPSRESALSERGAAPLLRERVLKQLAAGPATADECAAALGLTVLQSRPRVSELLKMGRIEDSGGRRRNASGKSATVWRLREVRQQQELGL